jgi:hypothetical protein
MYRPLIGFRLRNFTAVIFQPYQLNQPSQPLFITRFVNIPSAKFGCALSIRSQRTLVARRVSRKQTTRATATKTINAAPNAIGSPGLTL